MPSPYPNLKSVVPLLLALLGTSVPGLAQEFAPLGASWTYEVSGNINNPPASVAIRYTSDRDTLLAGRTARIIEGEELYADGHWESLGAEVVTGSFDSVYVWMQDSFHLIFDFTAAMGDTITVTDQPFAGLFALRDMTFDTFAYRIDSVYTEALTGDGLTLQEVAYLTTIADNTHWGFLNSLEYRGPVPGQLLRGVGSLGRESMLGTTPDILYIPEYTPDRLTCYRDATRDYRFRGVDCEALIARYVNPSSVHAVRAFAGRVYPNPFHATLRLEAPAGSTIERIEVRDMLGRMVAYDPVVDSAVDLGYLRAGLYRVTVFDGLGGRSVVVVRKI